MMGPRDVFWYSDMGLSFSKDILSRGPVANAAIRIPKLGPILGTTQGSSIRIVDGAIGKPSLALYIYIYVYMYVYTHICVCMYVNT